MQLFSIGVDTIKEVVYSRLKIKDEGAGYVIFRLIILMNILSSLRLKKSSKNMRGFHRREWIKVRPRNEALDCRVYAIAALSIVNVNVNVVAQKSSAAPVRDAAKAKRPKRRQATPRRQSGFVQGWR